VKFELEWSLQGRATIEADDRDEAENLLADGLLDLDSSMFETVTVDAVEELAE
jgi:hypothetical protein